MWAGHCDMSTPRKRMNERTRATHRSLQARFQEPWKLQSDVDLAVLRTFLFVCVRVSLVVCVWPAQACADLPAELVPVHQTFRMLPSKKFRFEISYHFLVHTHVFARARAHRVPRTSVAAQFPPGLPLQHVQSVQTALFAIQIEIFRMYPASDAEPSPQHGVPQGHYGHSEARRHVRG